MLSGGIVAKTDGALKKAQAECRQGRAYRGWRDPKL